MPDAQSADRLWQPITKLGENQYERNGSFAALEALHDEWKRELTSLTETDFLQRRQRTLRRLALETGIIERLYDIEWGVSLTLIAEGFAREVIERAGGKVDEKTLATLVAQREGLDMVIDFVNQDRKLTASFIKELHHAITRAQNTYPAIDTLGRVVDAPLHHGVFKQYPNHVCRKDGSVLQYCPPEHVGSEIDSLCVWYEELELQDIHPIVVAAWLHHRFVQIHPFEDGNGRVTRALTLLVMQRHHYAPLVIDRFHRDAYIDALDRANDGDLALLTRLFTTLESASLASELERVEEPEHGTSGAVAHTLAAQLAERRRQRVTKIANEMNVRAVDIMARVEHWFHQKEEELLEVFHKQGIHDVKTYVVSVRSPDPRSLYYRRQVIDTANRTGHFADFSGFVGLIHLGIVVSGLRLVFLASMHSTGRFSGVLAVTTFGIIRSAESEPGEAPELPVDIATSIDSFLFVHTETLEQLAGRAQELEKNLDDGLSIALVEMLQRV